MGKLTGVRRLMHYLKKRKTELVFILLYSLLVTAVGLLPIQLIGLLVDTLGHQPVGTVGLIFSTFIGSSVVGIILWFAAVYLLSAILSNLYGYWITMFNDRVIEAVRKDLFRSVIHRAWKFEQEDRSADIVTRAVGDVEQITRVLAGPLNGFLQKILTLLFSLLLLGMWNWKVVLITLLIAVILYRFSTEISKENNELGKAERMEVQKISLQFSDVLKNLPLIQSYRTEGRETVKLFDISNALYGVRRKLLGKMSGYWVKVYVLNTVGFLMVFFILLSEIEKGRCSVGEIVVAYTYLERIFSAMISVSRYKTDVFHADAALSRVFERIDEDSEPISESTSTGVQQKCGLRVEDASFGYGGETVLRHLNFKVRQGEMLVITGTSGIGKSTILHGLLGFVDLYEGKIFLGEEDVSEEVDVRRSRIRCCFQEPFLFRRGVKENLNYDGEFENTGVWETLGVLSVSEESVESNSEGNLLGLSGGEQRRIAVGRTVNKAVPVYLFDEPTAELDEENRRNVLAVLAALKEKSAVIVASHDQDLVEMADHRLELLS